MTWAKNYGDRFSGSASQTGNRARAISKACAKCGTGIERRKTYCGPCYDVRLEENNRKRHSAKVSRVSA